MSHIEKKRLLLTGFGPFGEHEINPSWSVVEEIAKLKHRFNNWDVFTKKIEVSYKYVDENIPKLWDEINPDLVIHLGVKSGCTSEVTLEMCANSMGYTRRDIYGCQVNDIENFTNLCLTSQIDFGVLISMCMEDNLAVCKSMDAGRYLCEYIYFTSLNMHRAPTLFIHVPVLTEDMTLKQVVESVVKIIELCMKQVKN